MTTKKIICIITATLVLATLIGFCSCSASNKQFFDTVYTFDSAIIELPDGTIVKGAVDSWRDFEDGDQLQVKINGVTYLVHSSKCVLIAEKKEK